MAKIPDPTTEALPISLPPWVHRVMIRTHAPKNSTMKLCLFTVNSFMNEAGEAWPGQPAIAEAASLTVNTVQRVLAEAIDLGWLSVTTRAVSENGKDWKHYFYRASVPAEFENCPTLQEETVAKAVDAHLSTQGPIPKGGRIGRKERKTPSQKPKVPLLKSKVPLLNAEGPHPDDVKVPLLKPKVPSQDGAKSSSEVLILSSHQKFPHEAAAASGSRASLGSRNGNGNSAEVEQPSAQMPGVPKAERERMAAAMLAKVPDQPLKRIARDHDLSMQEMERLERLEIAFRFLLARPKTPGATIRKQYKLTENELQSVRERLRAEKRRSVH